MARRLVLGPIARPDLDTTLDDAGDLHVGDRDDLHQLAVDHRVRFAPRVRLVDINDCRFEGVALTATDFTTLTVRNVLFQQCELSGVVLTETRVGRTEFTMCRMSGLTAPALRLTDVRFTGCRLDTASFRGATAERVAFIGCDLTEADFTQARLVGCSFMDCRLERADFSGVLLDRVSFHGSNLSGVRGATSLRGAVIASDQVIELAHAALDALGVIVNDDDPTATLLVGQDVR